jgi:glycosyltransferase involved in cell wall biosynthesis/predicted O-methyltransferase YrrM
MRFHILGIPHTVSSKEYNACAYTQKVVKFGKMMKARGHEIIHYGHEDSDLVCDEHVSVLTNKDFEISYGSHDWRKTFFKFDLNDHAYQTFFKNAIREVGKRKQKNDFILPFWGSGGKPICDAHEDLICVEPGIGYAGGHWARWKIFESYAIYHAYCGIENVGTCKQDWYEVVIPNYFDLDDFEYSDQKEDYFLYLGRVYDGKGVNIAIEATKLAGVKLIIAGQKEEGYTLPSHVEYIGYADVETRKKLMSKAKASFLASMYIEPFGGVQIENLLSGTPTITTDWGSFVENNLHGITGYRCRTMGDFVQAIKNIDKIKPSNCRSWGENFSLEKVGEMYEKYFQDVLNVYTRKGWYEVQDKKCLKALEKKYAETNNNCKDLIDEALRGVEDTSQHKITLFSLALSVNAKNILELGVRKGITTTPLLEASSYTKGRVTSVDIMENTQLHYLKSKYKNWNYVIQDSIKFLENISNDEIYDLIFIDDWHDGDHLYKEIQLLEPHITPFTLILIHDSMCYNTQPNYHYFKDEGGEFGNGGPYGGLEKLDKNIWEYSTIPVNNGLTILRKKGEVLNF